MKRLTLIYLLALVCGNSAFAQEVGFTPPTRTTLGAWPQTNVVTDFGYDSSGTSLVDLTKITALVGNQTVYWPPGTYNIGCPTAKSMSSNVSMIGAGQGITTLKFSAACAIPNGNVFYWNNTGGAVSGGVRVAYLTIDMNGATRAATPTSILGMTALAGFEVDHVSIINGAAANVFLISEGSSAAAPGKNIRIHDNYLAFAAASTTGNQCILQTDGAGGGIYDFVIANNTCVNSAIEVDGHDGLIQGNDVSGWGYGAGVTVDATTATYAVRVIGNNLHDSNMALDSNATAPEGVELWAKDSVISANTCKNLYGECVHNGGKNTSVTGNQAYGVSQRGVAGTCAFTTAYTDPTYNGNGSVYTGNRALDDGSNNLKWGYCDQSASVDSVTLAGNEWSGVTGSQNILGTNVTNLITTNTILYGTSGTFSYTPTKGARVTEVQGCGGGGGGGGGALDPVLTGTSGGGGGGGAGCFYMTFRSADLATETVTVGVAGSKGTAAATPTTAGGNGGTGGNTSFGSLITGYGGGGGAGGQIATTASGGGGGAGMCGAGGASTDANGGTAGCYGGVAGGGGAGALAATLPWVGSGGAGSSTTGVAGLGGAALAGGGGGGGGGGLTAATGSNNGGFSGRNQYAPGLANGGTAGTPAGGNSVTPNAYVPGHGGGGGYGNGAGNAGNGGAGSQGDGGGGGGSAVNGSTAGDGGAGGTGFVFVIEHF